MRAAAAARSRTAGAVLCLLGYLVSTAVTKTLQEDNGAEEVTLKVHLSDASTRRPLGGATIELFSNHTSVAVETSAAEGDAYLRFPYRLGALLVVTATKQGYVPRSAPWTPSRRPGPGARPWVQFQRRALTLPPNVSYANLTALLTIKKKFELTPVAAISVHLLASDGEALQVHEPITVSP
ncbi:hypothetical protein CRUP_034921 [Coryphaenoides rupestris]|nr:hypothetical protein CRUP_034921 [Coryphaenoides rupestris]